MDFKSIAREIVLFLFHWFYGMLESLVEGMLSLLVDLIAYNPDINAVHSVWTDVVGIITSLYIIVFIVSGIALLAGTITGNPGRTFREWVLKSIAGLILVNASFELYELILGLEEAMVKEVFVNADLSGFIVAGGVSIILFIIDLALLLGVAIVFLLRHILVMVGAVFFPLSIFLYLLPPTRRIGSVLLNLMFMAVFMPFFWALLLRISMACFCAMSPDFGGFFNAIFGMSILLLLIAMPFLLFKISFLVGGVTLSVLAPRYSIRRGVMKVRQFRSRFRKKEDLNYIG